MSSDGPTPAPDAPAANPSPAPFDLGRDRGLTWARAALDRAATGTGPDGGGIEAELGVRAVQDALGTDRGEAAWGFLFGVREVVESLPPYQRPNVIFEVKDPRGTHQLPGQARRGFWANLRAALRGEL